MSYINWVTITLLSAILFAVKDILAKKYFNDNITPNQLIFEEYLLLFMIIILLFSYHVDFNSFFLYWHLYFLKAFCVGFATTLYFWLLKRYNISLVSPILNLSPLILLFLSIFILSENITNLQILGICIIIFFTYYLEVTIHHHHKDKPHKHHFLNLKKLINNKLFLFLISTLLIVVLVSFAAILDKLILGRVNVFTNLYFTSIIILTVLIIYYIKENSLKKSFKIIIEEPKIMLISIITIISSFLIVTAIGIPTAMVSLIIPLRRTSTLFSSIFGGLIFHEKHLSEKIFAVIGMLIGVIIIVL